MWANTYASSFRDLQLLYNLEYDKLLAECPARFTTVLRQQRMEERLTNGDILRFGQSRLWFAEFLGAGIDGLALRIAAERYYETCGPAKALRESRSGTQVVIKVREMSSTSWSRRTSVREIFAGVMVRRMQVPYVVGIRRWTIWSGIEVADRIHARVGVSNAIGNAQVGISQADITDFLSAAVAHRVRAHAVGLSSSAPDIEVDRQYIHKRIKQRQRTPRPITLFLELENAGSRSFWRVMYEDRICSLKTPHAWHFFRCQMLVIGQQLMRLQQAYGFVHGDFNPVNIIMYESRVLPECFDDMWIFRSGEGVARLEARDLSGLFPKIIDLSRSAFSPNCAATVDIHDREFVAAAVHYVDGYLRTIDIRRLGLTLASSIMYVLFGSNAEYRVSIEDMDWRIVRAIRLMVDGSPAWIRQPNFFRVESPVTTAKSSSLHVFFTRLVFITDTLWLVERAARNEHRREKIFGQLTHRFKIFHIIWEIVSADLNNYVGQMLERCPTLEDNDPRLPANFVNWDIWRL